MGDLACGDTRIYLELAVRRVQCRRCGTVKQEGLGWPADDPFFSYGLRRCHFSAALQFSKKRRAQPSRR
ncbi:MAG TPA: hypothetical protein DEP35_15515 [Deltaproteobacteria bacterium]|nr:hypothetical protein [Deltaproteobacteria bacterium]